MLLDLAPIAALCVGAGVARRGHRTAGIGNPERRALGILGIAVGVFALLTAAMYA